MTIFDLTSPTSTTNTQVDGISIQSGVLNKTVFTIPHGLYTTPSIYNVSPLSSATFASRTVTIDANNIIITYDTAPAAGTNNLKWYYYAKLT